MKKVCAIAAALLLFALTACGQQQPREPEGGNVQIPNPWVDCATLSEAAELAGFDVAVPGHIEGYPNQMIQAMVKTMIQVMYFDGDPAAESSSAVTVRKGTGEEDISGDYNEYPESKTAQIHGMDVLLKGENGLIHCATWTRDGYSYAINADKGLSVDVLSGTIEEMITVVG